MTTILNMTPHDVVIYDSRGENVIRRFPKSEYEMRVDSHQVDLGEIDGIPLKSEQKLLGITITTSTTPDVSTLLNNYDVIIVSEMCMRYRFLTEDGKNIKAHFVCPNTAPESVVRGGNGQILGVKSFSSYSS
jgi:hypothetical protein